MRQLLRRAWYAFRRRQFEADLAEELDFHRELKQREIEGLGAGPTEASFAARRALGSIALAQDLSRDVWCPRWLEGIEQDMRLALRSLRGTPIVTTVAVVSLALGIGANTAMFSLVNSLLLRTLPVRQPERLVIVRSHEPEGYPEWSYPFWNEIRQRPQLVDAVAAWSPTARANFTVEGVTQKADSLLASGSFFDRLGVPALIGRTFSDADDRRGGGPDGPVAVISYGFWQRQFGGSVTAIGRTFTLENVPFTIVGVTPPEFFGADVGRTFDVIAPLNTEPLVAEARAGSRMAASVG
jgi:putative ABC transport system permease protein